ncbi:conjugative transposon protein TraK [Pedobacter sp.]|jgi:conjugative transposon TraK protein|uniref:conjugative transposon protein TraK n=1 Tax=Pedobacter sp. TaxID=1411316 RepID=UPI002CB4DADE|nr:conjugative transposon protein TraK [Pedobacter sp.]HWW43127.1 conjugative transposon protein TraK [Pedobacter sp.]
MIFNKMKNLDTAFRNIRTFSVICICGSFILCCFVVYKSYSLVGATQAKIYVLANGKALEAYASDRKDNIPAEAKDHVKTFHQLFFTLAPDEKAINSSIGRSLYLADASAKIAYDNLKEGNYYSNIISGNVNQTINVDSVYIDINQYPYLFRCYATQQLTRPTSVVIRNLVTQGRLRNVTRSENNSHGFLIEKWETIDNKDLSVKKR